MTSIITHKNLQRGAMFGLDARITLVIASIIGLVIGINQLARINSHKVSETQQRMTAVQTAALRFYDDTGTLATGTASLLVPDAFGQDYLDVTNSVDAWDNAYTFLHHTFCGSLLAGQQAGLASSNIIIISAGSDGVLNHDYTTDYNNQRCDALASNMEALMVGDDLMVKANTYNIDLRRFAQAQKQLEEIKEKIEALAAHNRLRWQRNCEASGLGLTGCDYDADGLYTLGEELGMNFFPEATEVVAGCAASRPFYADNASFTRSYASGDLVSMQSLMTMLGLPIAYAQFGPILQYDSNDGDICVGPFNFKLWYY